MNAQEVEPETQGVETKAIMPPIDSPLLEGGNRSEARLENTATHALKQP